MKNIPDDLYAHLKEAASVSHRSVNSEIIVCIERALRSREVSPEALLERASQLREMTRRHRITDTEFTRAKRAGRS